MRVRDYMCVGIRARVTWVRARVMVMVGVRLKRRRTVSVSVSLSVSVHVSVSMSTVYGQCKVIACLVRGPLTLNSPLDSSFLQIKN